MRGKNPYVKGLPNIRPKATRIYSFILDKKDVNVLKMYGLLDKLG